MSVPPVSRAIKQLIGDLNLAFKKVKNMENVNKNKDREKQFHFDQGKAGFKFAFHEGLGFLEYGQFLTPQILYESGGDEDEHK